MISLPLPGSLSRFADITEALCRAVAASLRFGVMQGWMILIVWGRIRRAERRLLALVERLRDGRYRTKAPAAEQGPRGEAAAVPPAVPPSAQHWQRLPRRFAWLVAAMPHVAAAHGAQLQALLAEPDMAALLRDIPQAGRILRPVCWMLGMDLAALTPAGDIVPVVEIAARDHRLQEVALDDADRHCAPAGSPALQPGMAWLRSIPG